MAYVLTRKALILDLYAAFALAKKHKSNRAYVKVFEANLKCNIERLAQDLLTKSYEPEPSSCFIVERPKKREVFAAQFRDRIVHHLYFNYTHLIFERTFIQDTYSCISNRGTHYGIARLAHHIRCESNNYTRPCYVLKMDKRGYFMHINRQMLCDIACASLEKMRHHRVSKYSKQTWDDVIDFNFVLWLTKEIAMLSPKDKCKVVGKVNDWDGLDKSKSLFHTNEGCGIPIGNLTSQLFSNVYLNVFDQFIKRELKFKHYGRYVDDSYIVCSDKKKLLSSVPIIRSFLHEKLALDLHMGKLQIIDVNYGVEFLGAFIKPKRNYVSNSTLRRSKVNIDSVNTSNKEKAFCVINSLLGTLIHYKSYNIRRHLFFKPKFLSVGYFDRDFSKLCRFDK